MKKKKQSKSVIFIQSYGTYSNEMLVLVGVQDKKDIYKFCKKNKVKFEFTKWVLNDFNDWKASIIKRHTALFCCNEDIQGVVVMLRPFEDTWEYWENLIHELHHAVQHMAKKRMMFEEAEAQAYLLEFLFHNIRRKLQKVDPL